MNQVGMCLLMGIENFVYFDIDFIMESFKQFVVIIFEEFRLPLEIKAFE
jgi:hypothetical protein